MAAKLDLLIEHGATFHKVFRLSDKNGQPVDLSEYISAKMEIREKAPGANLVLSLTNTNGRILLADVASGVIELMVSIADIASIDQAKYFEYDLFLAKASGYTKKLLKGEILVERKVTA